MEKESKLLLPTILVLVLLALGGISSLSYATPPKSEPLQTRVNLQDLEQHNQYLVQFYSQTLLNVTKTEVSFPYAFPDKVYVLWLGYTPTDPDMRTEILVSHPLLLNLTWEAVTDDNLVFLYQRNPQYSSTESFMNGDISPGKVMIDPLLKKRFPQFESSLSTDVTSDLDSVDYILTTYNHSDYENGVYYFKKILNASDAYLTDNKAIEWYLRAPELVETPGYYLVGNFSINYIQY